MKKLIYCAAALATMIFAGSCQQENLEPEAKGNTVTYTVELPDVQTKAIGDAGNVNQLIYEVWKTELPNQRDLKNSAKATRLYQKSEPILNGRTIITVNLVQDQDYTILFWAQKENEGIYTTNDLTSVSYTKGLNGGENGYKSNDETHAAFYGIDFIEDNDNNRKSKTVILKRPFAQLNIASLNTSTEYGVEVLKSKVVVANVGTVFNVAQNYVATPEDNRTQIAVGGASEVTFDYANDPSGDNEYLYINGKKSEYEHVAMNYLFATGDNVTVSYEIYTKLTGKDAANKGTVTYATVSNTVYEVPLQENYRTNIIGNLLTSTTEYTVEIDQNFVNPDYVIGDEWSQAGDYNYTVNPGASPVALKEILEHADAAAKANIANKYAVEAPMVTINLSDNVEWETGSGIGSTPLLPENSPISAVVINGNGKTFTATGKGVGTIRLANGALLTFNNVKIIDKSVSYAEGNWEYGYLEFAGKLEFNNCQFVNAVMMQAENAAFVNCSFNSNHDNEYAVWVSKGNVTFTGSTFAGARGLKVHEAYGSNVVSVSVDGCLFDQISMKPGIALGDLDERTTVTVKNSTFDRCQAGDQQTYMYETDTDVTTFTFISENNIVIPCDDTVLPQGDGSVVVSTSAGLKAAIESAGNQEVLTIKLANGTYTGAFDIPTKLVKIVALNRHQAVIDGLVHGLNSSHIALEGLVLTNANPVASESARHKADYYCLVAYASAFVIEDCIFNVNNQGNAAGKGAINIGDGFNAYSASDEFELIVKNTVFNCNGERPIRAKTSSWIEGCTFVDQHRYAIQVQGNNQAASEKVVFTNNKVNDPCLTSGEPFAAGVQISHSQLCEEVALTISGNTLESELFSDLKFAYDWEEGCSSCLANMQITTCSLNGNQIVAGQCMPINDEAYEVLNEVAYTYDEATSTYTIYSARGLKWVADVVNATTPYTATLFDNATVELANDIDLKNEEWIPIGDDRLQRTEFHGTFDGKGYTVKNVKITKKTDRDDENKSSYGLFGNLKGTVKNLTVENVSISGAPKFIGALVGRMNDGLIENCHVKNSSVECKNWTIGGLVGQLNNGKISGCTVEGTTVKGYAAVAAIAGIALNKGERVIENCSVKNCTLVQNGSFGYDNYDYMFGAIVGTLYSGELTVNLNNCSVEKTTIKGEPSSELCGFVSEGDKLLINGYEFLSSGLGYDTKRKTYAVSSAEGLVALSKITIKGNESVILTADIDLTGVEFNGLSAFNSETPNTFDGQNHVVSNWTYTGGAADMGFIKVWAGTIKNVTIKNASLKTNGRSAVLAAKVYANIENCHVVSSSIEDSFWACGVVAGHYNSGSITNCSVDECFVKSNGGTGAIVGVINEAGGERKVENCTVKNTTVNNTGAYGETYSGALVAGMFNADGATYILNNCTLENNTKQGNYVGDLFYATNGETVIVDGVQQ